MIEKSLTWIAKNINGKLIGEDKVIKGVFIDSRKLTEGSLFVPIKGESDGHDYILDALDKKAFFICDENYYKKNQNIIGTFIVVKDTIKALQSLSKAYRDSLDIKIVGITGSDGKTSTKDFLYQILNQKYKTQKTMGNYNNELGLPLSILNLKEETELAVLEMGMDRLGDIDLLSNIARPDIAIIVNVTDTHLGSLGSKENILKAKLEILNGLKKDGTLVYHGDNINLKSEVEKRDINRGITFGINEGADYKLELINSNEEGIKFKINNDLVIDLPIIGAHQMYNILAALIVGNLLEVDIEEGVNSLRNIKLTSMRNELIEKKDYLIINDAYKSTPSSLRASIKMFTDFKFENKKKMIVLADMLEVGGDEEKTHFDIGSLINNDTAKYLITVGDLAKNFALGAKKFSGDKLILKDKNELYEFLNEFDKKDWVILFKGSRRIGLEDIIDQLT